ncbi:MAG: protease inhibitor I42 family protein [Phycisphaerales bacterium]|jgi:inhibitor of cysteine peptidase|nr:protease inhibitor I42 family protein [Phycisphaerales bacterium]MDP6889898.1 protease inhibitor I42 family protein [Phycisphaerales bacterium]
MKWNRWCAAGLLSVFGCHGSPSGDLVLSVGGRGDILLPYTAGTGYSWSLDQGGSEGLTCVSVSESGTKPDTADLPGGPGQSRWLLKGRSPGTAELLFEYRRPWEKDTPPAETRRVRVEVR